MKAKRVSAILLTVCMALTLLSAPASAEPIDPTLIFSPETPLTVFVDGKASAELSGEYPYGEEVALTAPTVSGKTFLYWTNDEGATISYNASLTLVMYAHTVVNAVYGASAATAQPTAAFLNITRSSTDIIYNAIAAAPSDVTAAGVRYSTSKSTLDALKGSEGVTVAVADTTTTNWTLTVTPADEDTTYYAVAYATAGGQTVYSAVKTVKFGERKGQ